MSIRTAKLLDVPLLVAMGQATTFFPMHMVTFMILPMGTFFLMFGESVANLCSWCNILGSSSRFYGVSGKMSERLFTYFMGVSFTKPMETL
jgi:hypothetical protein